MIAMPTLDVNDADWEKWSVKFDRFDAEKTGIAYKEGYKYQLDRDYLVVIPITLDRDIYSDFICLRSDGLLRIKKGYAWDGPSGPTIDTRNFMRGSLVHDALYQLIREHGLDPVYRETADQTLRAICKEDGMTDIRAWWVYEGVRFGGGAAVAHDNPVLHAP
ncbi:MAG: DUF1353 domain-containing protein [Desulfocapsaceae bacterium]|nr:DUF1353 domain-containing protein [Desulfocapsaceae bacterium]